MPCHISSSFFLPGVCTIEVRVERKFEEEGFHLGEREGGDVVQGIIVVFKIL